MSVREKEIGRAIAAFSRHVRRRARRSRMSQEQISATIAQYMRDVRRGKARLWWPR